MFPTPNLYCIACPNTTKKRLVEYRLKGSWMFKKSCLQTYNDYSRLVCLEYKAIGGVCVLGGGGGGAGGIPII